VSHKNKDSFHFILSSVLSSLVVNNLQKSISFKNSLVNISETVLLLTQVYLIIFTLNDPASFSRNSLYTLHCNLLNFMNSKYIQYLVELIINTFQFIAVFWKNMTFLNFYKLLTSFN
jgi:hypothetical protein